MTTFTTEELQDKGWHYGPRDMRDVQNTNPDDDEFGHGHPIAMIAAGTHIFWRDWSTSFIVCISDDFAGKDHGVAPRANLYLIKVSNPPRDEDGDVILDWADIFTPDAIVDAFRHVKAQLMAGSLPAHKTIINVSFGMRLRGRPLQRSSTYGTPDGLTLKQERT
jgi:hypothetical protein